MFSIRELKIDEQDETGVQAISFVDFPAIETDFEYFAKAPLLPYFKYEGPKDDKNRGFCADRVGNTYHIDQIRSWKPVEADAPTGTNFFQTFDMDGGINYEGVKNYNCDSEMFGCRHKLVRVTKMQSEQHFVKMEMVSQEKKEVQGLVLKSNQMIYRNDVDGNGNPGYVYFSRDTVRKLKQKYGYNRSITFQHRDDVTGQAILMDSWLEETDKDTMWMIKYKIIGPKLWDMVKNEIVKGFSIEAIFAIQ